MTVRTIQALEGALEKEKPDLVVIYGGIYATSASIFAAVKMHFPVCYVEPGIRNEFASNQEEVDRLCADSIASVNCAQAPLCLRNPQEENGGGAIAGDLMPDAFRKYYPMIQSGFFALLISEAGRLLSRKSSITSSVAEKRTEGGGCQRDSSRHREH